MLSAQPAPKREFRGVWIHTILNGLYPTLTSEQVKDTLCKELDIYQKAGINAVIFQVRPESDAFYKSDIEPWSRYLTGEQGKAPDADFDPMEFMIEECHKRCMEFHAWLNPFRVNIHKEKPLADSHIYHQDRSMFVTYGKQLLFDPGEPKSRVFIEKVIADIVTRYDIDAIHMDDYFYPYPIKGTKFPDDRTFNEYGVPAGYTQATRGDWRRNNVNLLIKEINDTIKAIKPWVRFGISPFGIYRNKRQYAGGSNTNGLCCYDDLYADILLWMNEGWIDYVTPQLYWEIGHKLADYNILTEWWASVDVPGVNLYIGQDISRSRNQIDDKIIKARATEGVDGNCWWSGRMLLENMNGMLDSLTLKYQATPAIATGYTALADTSEVPVPHNLTFSADTLSWSAADSTLRYYAVYMFNENERIDVSTTHNLMGFTSDKSYKLPCDTSMNYDCKVFTVTAIDRLNRESKPAYEVVFNGE